MPFKSREEHALYVKNKRKLRRMQISARKRKNQLVNSKNTGIM